MVKCLLIDDDPDEYEIFSMALRDIDEVCSCQSISDAIEAISLLENDRSFIPEFIFIDINMPGLSGVQCLDLVKKMHHLDNIPVIMYSNSSDQSDIRIAENLGASHYFVKPVRMSILSQTLSKLFQKESLPFVLP